MKNDVYSGSPHTEHVLSEKQPVFSELISGKLDQINATVNQINSKTVSLSGYALVSNDVEEKQTDPQNYSEYLVRKLDELEYRLNTINDDLSRFI